MDKNVGNTGVSETFILGLIASVAGVISLIFSSMRKSRCGDLYCCCGLFSCKRTVLTTEEMKLEPLSPKHMNNIITAV